MGRTTGLWAVLGLLALTATATAAQGSLDLAEPRVGDAGVYEISSLTVDGEAQPDATGPALAFQVAEEEPVLDAHGNRRLAWPVELWYASGDGWRAGTAWTTGPGQAPVRVTVPAGTSTWETWGPGGSLIGERQQGNLSRQLTSWADDAPLEGAWCLVANPLQDAQLAEQRSVDGACTPASGSTTAITDVRPGERGGRIVQAETSTADPHVELGLRDTVPYPTTVTFSLTVPPDDEPASPWVAWLLDPSRGPTLAPDEGIDLQGELTLTRFDRGDGPRLADQPDPPRSAEALDRAPADRWGPASGDSPLAFPLAEAVDVLTEDPRHARFQAWWADHPDARLVLASYDVSVRDHQRLAHWWLTVVEPGGSGWTVDLVKRTGLAAANTTLAAESPHPIETWTAHHASLDTPYPEALDEPVPTIGAALRAWKPPVHVPDDAEANRVVWYHGDEARLAVGWSPPDRTETSPPRQTVTYEANGTLTAFDPVTGTREHRVDWQGRMAGELDLAADPVAWSSPSPAPDPELPSPSPTEWVGALGLATLLVLLVANSGALVRLISRNEIFDDPTRRAIYEAIRDEPGLDPTTIAERVDRSRSTVRYHLRQLEDAGLAQDAGPSGVARWFPTEGYEPDEARAHAVLSIGRTRELFEAIAEQPGTYQRELARVFDVHRSAVHRIVDRLVEAGLVDRVDEGDRVRLYPDHEDVDRSGHRA